jgi:REP element-mobilizing transposase RayT
MAGTYSQVYHQLVFAVQGRENLIRAETKDRIHKYLTGILQGEGHKMLAIGGMPDHIHIFYGHSPKQAISDLVRVLKTRSTTFIKSERLSPFNFSWQEGYGVFSYARSQRDEVIKYVLNQEAHHQKKTFRQEYIAMLQKFEIEFEEKYLLDWIE